MVAALVTNVFSVFNDTVSKEGYFGTTVNSVFMEETEAGIQNMAMALTPSLAQTSWLSSDY